MKETYRAVAPRDRRGSAVNCEQNKKEARQERDHDRFHQHKTAHQLGPECGRHQADRAAHRMTGEDRGAFIEPFEDLHQIVAVDRPACWRLARRQCRKAVAALVTGGDGETIGQWHQQAAIGFRVEAGCVCEMQKRAFAVPLETGNLTFRQRKRLANGNGHRAGRQAIAAEICDGGQSSGQHPWQPHLAQRCRTA